MRKVQSLIALKTLCKDVAPLTPRATSDSRRIEIPASAKDDCCCLNLSWHKSTVVTRSPTLARTLP